MNSEQLFELALNLGAPWRVEELSFTGQQGSQELRIRIGYAKGSKFEDANGQRCSVYDSEVRHWQHLDFFQHRCIIECKVPRILDSTGKVKTVVVPWAREGSGFTLLLEALMMSLIESEMPVSRVAQLLGVNAPRVWVVFNYWISRALRDDCCKSLTRLGVDETSSKRGQDYITVAVDLDQRRVVAVTEKRNRESVQRVSEILKTKGATTAQISEVSMDLSPSYIAGVSETFHSAKITFDRFHVVKLLNQAMMEVYRVECAWHRELKGNKYTFVRNRDTLSSKQEANLTMFTEAYPSLGEAYRLKVLFNDLWDMADAQAARSFVIDWCAEVERKRIRPLMVFAKTVRGHLTGIVRFIETRISNGILEGINSKIQLAKRRARGFRKIENFMNMIYFLCGRLKMNYPHQTL